jgi:hypothetical protein
MFEVYDPGVMCGHMTVYVHATNKWLVMMKQIHN